MRAYRIELTSKNGVSIGGNNQPNYQPPTTLVLQQNLGNMDDNIHIEFECVSYCDTSNKEIYDRAVLSLYNVNRYWHNENSSGKLAGARVVIYAGVKATPIHYRQGLVDPQNTCYALNDNQILTTPIYDGYVANSYANMDGVSTVLVLNLIPVKELTEEEKASVNQLNIALGTAWRNEVKRFIDNYLKLVGTPDVKVQVGNPTKGSIIINEAITNTINIEGIFETKREGAISLVDFVKTSFKEVIKKEGNTIYIGENPNVIAKMTVISDKDLLGQPQLINPNTITLTVPLTSKFKILQKIQLKLESYIGYSQAFTMEADPSSFGITADRVYKMYEGTYQIISIRPVMQSRNTSVEAWCTILEAVKIL
ncbi:hypothetical protein [Brachyspira pilosicoli]|uniref:hypothetical protein n=1 Tax=Brachyspira pilosicoli TaxID=52584 RepID=UPI000E1AD320|nr:hypothetical protein [Brachyspira pilosicoli]MBW5391382.1 hypothetical protein [Brachyspira pilosicoli]SUV99486.1 Uncharacterised protein [Brachyspira pilosicoli]